MISAYAAKHKDDDFRLLSSSGGAFPALAEYVLQQEGVVYGARYDDEMRVVHARATTMGQCRAFSGSKYVQSSLGSTFVDVRNDLIGHKKVLFSGTPCQVAGLKSYLSQSRISGDLVTVDLVCYGVMSPLLMREHMRFLEKRLGEKVIAFTFRDKSHGWHNLRSSATTQRGSFDDNAVQALLTTFRENIALRPSCHSCPFSNWQRPGDLTVGDCWGIQRHLPAVDDNKGVSLILVNSPRGLELLQHVKHRLDLWELTPEQVPQPRLQGPTPPSRYRDRFWRVLHEKGYEKAVRRFTEYGVLRRWYRRARRAVSRVLH